MPAGAAARALAIAGTCLAWSLGSVSLAQQPVPVGDVIHVKDTTGLNGVAGDGSGGFVVVWTEPDGSGRGTFGRRFDGGGNPLGAAFQANTYTTGNQTYAGVAMNASGDFVVVWESRPPQPGLFSEGDIFARRFDASANPAGPEFQVTVATLGRQAYPSVAMAGDGSFVVAWDGDTQAQSYRAISARRFDGLGNPAGGDFVVAWSDSAFTDTEIAMNPAGEFVVVTNDLSTAMRGRRFDASANPLGPDFPLSESADMREARVAMDQEGGFIGTWHRGSFAGPLSDVKARRFDSSGNPGPEFTVNAYTTGEQAFASVASFARNEVVVVWQHAQPAGGQRDVFGRRFDRDGNPLSAEFRVNAYTTGHQSGRIAATSADSFVVVWSSSAPEAGTFAQRFSLTPDDIFADGFESGDLSAWSLAQTDGGDLAVSGTAAMASSTFGVRALVDDTAGVFVQDESPNQEARYRARFYFDPGTFDPGEASGHQRTRIFLAFADAPLRRLVQIVLRRLDGQYSLAAHVRQDDNTLVQTVFVPIAAGPHAIELDWQKATGAGAPDGRLELWIDGNSVAELTALDNDERPVEFARLGAMSVKSGASGTFSFDEFVSRRWSYIGP